MNHVPRAQSLPCANNIDELLWSGRLHETAGLLLVGWHMGYGDDFATERGRSWTPVLEKAIASSLPPTKNSIFFFCVVAARGFYSCTCTCNYRYRTVTGNPLGNTVRAVGTETTIENENEFSNDRRYHHHIRACYFVEKFCSKTRLLLRQERIWRDQRTDEVWIRSHCFSHRCCQRQSISRYV